MAHGFPLCSFAAWCKNEALGVEVGRERGGWDCLRGGVYHTPSFLHSQNAFWKSAMHQALGLELRNRQAGLPEPTGETGPNNRGWRVHGEGEIEMGVAGEGRPQC